MKRFISLMAIAVVLIFMAVPTMAIDVDGDDVDDIFDNCIGSQYSSDQRDSDADGVGNQCDTCPLRPNSSILGTCTKGYKRGLPCTTDGACGGTNPHCSKSQTEDLDQDGKKDACEVTSTLCGAVENPLTAGLYAQNNCLYYIPGEPDGDILPPGNDYLPDKKWVWIPNIFDTGSTVVLVGENHLGVDIPDHLNLDYSDSPPDLDIQLFGSFYRNTQEMINNSWLLWNHFDIAFESINIKEETVQPDYLSSLLLGGPVTNNVIAYINYPVHYKLHNATSKTPAMTFYGPLEAHDERHIPPPVYYVDLEEFGTDQPLTDGTSRGFRYYIRGMKFDNGLECTVSSPPGEGELVLGNRFMYDTGAPFTKISTDIRDNLCLNPGSPDFPHLGYACYYIDRVEIDSDDGQHQYVLENAPVCVDTDPDFDNHHDIIVGSNFFDKQTAVLFDGPGSRLGIYRNHCVAEWRWADTISQTEVKSFVTPFNCVYCPEKATGKLLKTSGGSATMKLTVYDSEGTFYNSIQSDNYPIVMEITDTPEGGWVFHVEGVDVPDTYALFELTVELDWDGDGIPDSEDNCFLDNNLGQSDVDQDGLGDVCDNCPNTFNPDQEDTFPPPCNGIGDACDCEADFNCDNNVDATDVTNFLTDFGRSTFFNPCTNADPCNGDFDCNVNVDALDVDKFLEDFGRSQFFNPCPTCVTGNWCDYGQVEVHEVWVDDDWTGTVPGTLVEGHVFGTDAFDNIQDGIDGVTPPGMVYVAPGYYVENITMRSGVGIDGSGPELTTIDGGANGPVVTANNVDEEAGLFGFTITNGASSGSGGGLYFYNSDPYMDRCIVKDNVAQTAGGMYNESSSPRMTNCIFINNTAELVGGMYNYDSSSPWITNCLFYGNEATISRSCIYNYVNSSPALRNCIMWENIPGEIENGVSSLANVTYSDVQGSYAGTGNINLNPLFVNPASEDFHIQSGSPCIDAGTTAGMEYDMDFVSRPQGSAYDMGPYEYRGIGYTIDFLESGNPGGWTSSFKTFDNTWSMPLFSEVEVDVWLNACPEDMIAAGFWMEYDPTRVSIISIETYDNNSLPGPWDSGGSTIYPDPAGSGTYMVLVNNLGAAAPDAADDIIIAKVRLQLTEPLQTDITFRTIPEWDTVLGESLTIYDAEINPKTVSIDLNTSARFTDNGDGTVTDNDSGLVWLKDANCPEFFGGVSWDVATTIVGGLANGNCGLTDGSNLGDWRIPTVEETEALQCSEYINPCLCNTSGSGQASNGDPFSNVQFAFGDFYWTSTPGPNPNSRALEEFDSAFISAHGDETTPQFVWPVRNP